MSQNRLVVKFGGESGQGINTLGEILSKAIKNTGFHNFAYREYPSLIKGGVASYQIDISDRRIGSSLRMCDILPILDIDAIHEYIYSVRENGIIIYDSLDLALTEEEKNFINQNSIKLVSIDTKELALDAGGIEIMANMVLLGFIWRILGLEIAPIEEVVRDRFKDKKIDLEAEIKCLLAGYNSQQTNGLEKPISFDKGLNLKDSLNITGNQAIALGAISAGCRAYYAYPMTPSTSIFKFIGDTYRETGIVVKQAENEITAAQMAIGSMNMGTRAMVATSGGGFDLMSETISCAGISETPLVLVLAQRGGAGTGVPTWTGAGDLSLAVNAGHGEFPRCVISVSNPADAYLLTQAAFNIAEVYQLPVIILTEKQIAESIFNIQEMPEPIQIERGLNNGTNRYEITENGISPRWVPSEENPVYLQNSDEHKITGESTENSKEVIEMSDKRLRKLKTLKDNLPEPVYYGNENTETVLVSYGSTGNTIRDLITDQTNIGYLHYSYIYPLKFEKLTQLKEAGKQIISIENNQTGELSKLIKQESGISIDQKLLKYDGRPLFIEDILDFINK
ncbi:MAG: 2-oxoacid:acceptor oxidoreductase subunit alpha [Candidatus Dojkabacteria bacterium]|nr:2-oxoacid:acceptor oxidoreductase subunit alpha [Candidatus Dojkabacteria bacterium]